MESFIGTDMLRCEDPIGRFNINPDWTDSFHQ